MTPSERLIKAKELLVRDGWITHLLFEGGRRCALGAVYDTDETVGSISTRIWFISPEEFEFKFWPAIQFLTRAIGKEVTNQQHAIHLVASFNNARNDVKDILKWFDRAIELAQAAEMHRELESLAQANAEQGEPVRAELILSDAVETVA